MCQRLGRVLCNLSFRLQTTATTRLEAISQTTSGGSRAVVEIKFSAGLNGRYFADDNTSRWCNHRHNPRPVSSSFICTSRCLSVGSQVSMETLATVVVALASGGLNNTTDFV